MLIKKISAFLMVFFLSSNIMVNANNIENKTENKVENNIQYEYKTPNLNISAETYIVMDAKTGIPIIGKDIHKKMYPASLTKVFTSYLLLNYLNLNDYVVASENASKQEPSSIFMDVNEQISVKDALYAMMLKSANDVSYAVGEKIGQGNIEKFYEIINEEAKKIGALNSNFYSSNGLHNPNHYTTAYDISLIMREAIKNKDFLNAISTKTYKLTRTNPNKMSFIINHNKLLGNNQYIVGGKTGYTREAGRCLIEYAKKDNIEIIIAVLKSQDTYGDILKLMNYVFDNYQYVDIVNNTDMINYKGMDIKVKIDKPLSVLISKDINVEEYKNSINKKVITFENIKYPILANTHIGTLEYYVNNKLIHSTAIYNIEDIKKESHIIKDVLLFIFLLFAFNILRFYIKAIINKNKSLY